MQQNNIRFLPGTTAYGLGKAIFFRHGLGSTWWFPVWLSSAAYYTSELFLVQPAV